ncbi:hypothetical protein Xinn_01002 [Xenorhabdus innexi]|uniref:Uncharacterized protein n=1 Tax=Xenorhabdus innexi TaxID=290109 RepID=A0A2G0NRJ7_9GAMM|nr:hypothetical protein Xinn_01002 [Xenorhabdus innexi]
MTYGFRNRYTGIDDANAGNLIPVEDVEAYFAKKRLQK